MGQYHYVASIDKKEFFSPRSLGFFLKQAESEGSLGGVGDLTLALITTSPMRGGGDWHDDNFDNEKRILGRWVGSRVVYIGDYTERADLPFLTNAEYRELMHAVWGRDFTSEGAEVPVKKNPSISAWHELDVELREFCTQNFDLEYTEEVWYMKELNGTRTSHTTVRSEFKAGSWRAEQYQ